jgi:hypothetical protein
MKLTRSQLKRAAPEDPTAKRSGFALAAARSLSKRRYAALNGCWPT